MDEYSGLSPDAQFLAEKGIDPYSPIQRFSKYPVEVRKVVTRMRRKQVRTWLLEPRGSAWIQQEASLRFGITERTVRTWIQTERQYLASLYTNDEVAQDAIKVLVSEGLLRAAYRAQQMEDVKGMVLAYTRYAEVTGVYKPGMKFDITSQSTIANLILEAKQAPPALGAPEQPLEVTETLGELLPVTDGD